VHVQQLGLQCSYCHRTANAQAEAGMPAVDVCMGCHVAVGPSRNSNIKTLQDTWLKQQAVDWVRVWRMPDDVRFQHDVHIQAGIQCKDCHGDVGSMHQVAQGQAMKMQDCVACHQRMNAPTTCDTCHY
jgi:c(7)-type cytochrome triheme protein